MERLQILNVAFDRRREAQALGARWNAEHQAWVVGSGGDLTRFGDLLPIRDRPHVPPPYIRINLIPSTSWGCNLRAVMEDKAWRSFIRRHVYPTTGRRCLVCGERGDRWPVEADEVWRFDDRTGVQKLVAVVPLCPACHEVRSVGLASSRGRLVPAIRHLAWVNRWPIQKAEHAVDEAFRTWNVRSHRRWTVDVSYMAERYGMDVPWDEAAARAANRQLVAQASASQRETA